MVPDSTEPALGSATPGTVALVLVEMVVEVLALAAGVVWAVAARGAASAAATSQRLAFENARVSISRENGC